MENILDDSIKKFRSFVNEEENISYLTQKYIDNSEKNQWNCICSCMDWIDVASDYINDIEYSEDNFNKKCMQVYLYISAIDIIVEAINQLNRVINKEKDPLFKGDITIFGGKLGLDDNSYFKELRAAFGAHPVNLKSREDKNIKYFASWPLKSIFNDEYDFYCKLYVNDKQLEDSKIYLKIEQLNKFVVRRYKYLDNLQIKIKNDKNKYLSDILRKNKLKLTNNKFKDIENLKAFLNLIWENDYYEMLLGDMQRMLKAYNKFNIDNIIIKNYIDELDKVIIELYNNLSTGNFNEIDSQYIINPKVNLNKINDTMFSYYLEKLKGYIYNEENEDIKEVCIDRINNSLNSTIRLNYDMSRDEFLLFLNVSMWAFEKSN